MTSFDTERQTAERLADIAASDPTDGAVLAAAVAAVRLAGRTMLDAFSERTRTPDDLGSLVRAIHANDDASLAIARRLLERSLPTAGWVDDELEGGVLPPGDWWIFDAVEGNVNHVHGLSEWGISATLVRDGAPHLTVVYEPVADRLYTAVRGSGVAALNGEPLRPSTKTELKAAIVTTGQARPGESAETYRRIGASVTAMLNSALVVRMTVPATFQLGLVAGGQTDAFWQHSDVRSGLAAGALLVSEAGGSVTDLQGRPWSFASNDFLASAPGIQREALAVLGEVA
ncbi:inositol monophosphatase family protein [Mitsuaria sp. 7]|uniref:inositol monophosphatase family protein n=1 Tax=Mitsuaria sp. 7 TaxID=1658665 RepID=UPI0009ED3A90|nr:inositol monophosphatase family protein [Mitsuaria sp. 7]